MTKEMKLGRLILTHRKDYIDKLKTFYLDGGRTDFLVIAHNKKTVDTSHFKTDARFHLVPYCGRGPMCSVMGHQFRVWVDVARQFPEIEGWVVHDYDFCVPRARPGDLQPHQTERIRDDRQSIPPLE